RPQRQHRKHPWRRKENSPSRPVVGEQSSGAVREGSRDAAGDLPLPPWHRSLRTPVPVQAPVPVPPPSALTDYIKASKPKQLTPLRADLERHLAQLKARGPEHP